MSAMVGINLNLSNGKQYTTVPYQTSEAKIEHVPECRKPTQYACVRALDTRITRAVFLITAIKESVATSERSPSL